MAIQRSGRLRSGMPTFFGLRNGRFLGDVGLLEGAPLEVLLVSTTVHVPLFALQTGRLGLVTF